MTLSITVNLVGMEKLRATFSKLENSTQANSDLLLQTGEFLRESLQTNTPEQSGTLRKGWLQTKLLSVNIAIIQNIVPYAGIVEEGRKGGKVIRPVNKKVLHWVDESGSHFSKKVVQGAYKGSHFVKLTIESTLNSAVNRAFALIQGRYGL